MYDNRLNIKKKMNNQNNSSENIDIPLSQNDLEQVSGGGGTCPGGEEFSGDKGSPIGSGTSKFSGFSTGFSTNSKGLDKEKKVNSSILFDGI